MNKNTRKKVGYLEKKLNIFNFSASDNEIFLIKVSQKYVSQASLHVYFSLVLHKKFLNLLTIIIFR